MMQNLFQQGMFSVDPNSTPEMIKAKRAQIAALLPQFGKARYVGEGLGQLATGIATGVKNRKLDKFEGEKRQEAANLFNGVFSGSQGGGTGGPLSILGMKGNVAPDAAKGTPFKPPEGGMADYVTKGLMQRGLPEHVAQAFVMNFEDESNLDPGINEANPIVPGSRGGFGLSQWTGPRRKALEAYAAQRGVDVSDPDMQMDFLMTELQGSESAAAKAIFAAPDAGSAAAAVVNKFLRPAETHRARREAQYLGGASPAPQQAQQPQGPALNDLMMMAQNPWLSPEQRQAVNSMISQQQAQQQAIQAQALQQQDPLYQARLAQMQREANAPAERKIIKGIDGRNYYLDTQEPVLPDAQAPDTSHRMLSDAEVEGLNLPPGSYQMAPDGKVTPIGKGGVTVNNNMDTNKFNEEFGKADANALSAVSESGMAAQRNLARIGQLDSLLAQSPTGFTGAMTLAAGELGINVDGLDEAQAAQAIINSMVPEQRQPGSGPMSDADLALFKQSLPRVINQPGGNQMIMDTLRGIAEYDVQGAAIVQRLRGGEITRAEAFAALQARENPLSNFKAPVANPQSGGGSVPQSFIDRHGAALEGTGVTIEEVWEQYGNKDAFK